MIGSGLLTDHEDRHQVGGFKLRDSVPRSLGRFVVGLAGGDKTRRRREQPATFALGGSVGNAGE